jgi:hypothetical protein
VLTGEPHIRHFTQPICCKIKPTAGGVTTYFLTIFLFVTNYFLFVTISQSLLRNQAAFKTQLSASLTLLLMTDHCGDPNPAPPLHSTPRLPWTSKCQNSHIVHFYLTIFKKHYRHYFGRLTLSPPTQTEVPATKIKKGKNIDILCTCD